MCIYEYLRLALVTVVSVFVCFPSYSEECPDMKASYQLILKDNHGYSKPYDFVKIWKFNIDPTSNINLEKSLDSILSKKLPDPKYLCKYIGEGVAEYYLRCTDLQRNNLIFNTSTHYFQGIRNIPDKNGNLIDIKGINWRETSVKVSCSKNIAWQYYLHKFEWKGPPVKTLPFVLLGAYVWNNSLRIEPYTNMPEF